MCYLQDNDVHRILLHFLSHINNLLFIAYNAILQNYLNNETSSEKIFFLH